jgi:methionyl-tRNA formyltransferase
MRVLFMGNKNRGVVCLDAVLDRGDTVVGVVGPPADRLEGWYPSLPAHARERDIPVIQPSDINDPEVVSQLRAWNPDLIVMAGYSQILGEAVLSVPEIGVLNLHGGKLPEYRGASTLNWMIIEGETEGGIAILFADDGIDTGKIVLQERFPITVDETIVDIIDKTDRLFPELLVTALDRIETGSLDPTPQSPDRGCYYHSRRPQHGEIHWRERTAKEVHDLVRALAGPYPSAFTHLDGDRLEIEETSLLEETVRGVPGRVCLRRDEGVVVVARDRGVRIDTVTPAGGETQTASDFFARIGVDLGR